MAFQLVEALGVLERTRVADEVKGLQQPERANLRKYGVRFGAYHIYLPLLLKPAPRALAVQLWALSHDGPQSNGLDDLLHLAGSGRTSIPANKEIDAALYRTAGYRVCGERAVRVDILERLADLIRPALAWREGVAGQKPPGAIAGGGFIVVNTMTSLTGASGEDFASILRSLGYRMEKRPKPPEPAPAAEAPVTVAADNVDAPPTDPAAVACSAAVRLPLNTEMEVIGEKADDFSCTFGCIELEDRSVIENTASEVAPSEVASSEEESIAPLQSSAAVAAEAPTETPQEPTETPHETAVAAEPELIEVWRPGRPERHRERPRFRHREARKQVPKGTVEPTQDATVQAAAASNGASEARATADRTPQSEAAQTETPKPGRHSRPHRRRHGADQRFDRPRREQDRPSGPPARYERHERHEKAPDPNSPFAKLAALKAQLEADAKGRR